MGTVPKSLRSKSAHASAALTGVTLSSRFTPRSISVRRASMSSAGASCRVADVVMTGALPRYGSRRERFRPIGGVRDDGEEVARANAHRGTGSGRSHAEVHHNAGVVTPGLPAERLHGRDPTRVPAPSSAGNASDGSATSLRSFIPTSRCRNPAGQPDGFLGPGIETGPGGEIAVDVIGGDLRLRQAGLVQARPISWWRKTSK